MSCLYVGLSELNGCRVLKYGISKSDEPWSRIACHARSRDNPFGSRMRDWCAALCLVTGKFYEARAIETALRNHFLLTLPRAERFSRPTDLSVPYHDIPGISPSGEWLFHPFSEDDGFLDFLGRSIPAIRLAMDTGMRVLESAHAALCEAASAAVAGGGYASYDLRHRAAP